MRCRTDDYDGDGDDSGDVSGSDCGGGGGICSGGGGGGDSSGKLLRQQH